MIKNLIEKIFKRKELEKYKNSASILEKEVEEKASIIAKQDLQLIVLKSGQNINLTHNEKGMILNAIEHIPFREFIELPETKAILRITWRNLQEKIKLHLKEGD